MSKNKLSLINDNLTWNEKRRYKLNTVVSYFGISYQNNTGINSVPSLLIDWQIVKGTQNIPYTTFKFLHKGFGNNDLNNNEIGDIFCGWSNDGAIRFSEAKWLGGVLTDSNNFLPLVQTEI